MKAPRKGCYDYQELTAPEINELAAQAVVVLPLAATEQHGKHLCCGTDTFINEGLRDLLRDQPPEGCYLWLPTLWFGASEHHLEYGATISLKPSDYIQLLAGILGNLLDSGHKKILLLNSHGGNHAPMLSTLGQVADCAKRSNALVAGVTYWELAQDEWKENIKDLETKRMGHACELETSMIMHLRGDINVNCKDLPESPFPEWADMLGAVAATFSDLTQSGHMGNPAVASKEKGKLLLLETAKRLRDYFEMIYSYNRTTQPFKL